MAFSNRQEEAVAKLDKLLMEELSAVESYRQALERVGDEPGIAEIRVMEQDHLDAAKGLRRLITDRGGVPSADAGPWDFIQKFKMGAATLLSDIHTLVELRKDENRVLSEYELIEFAKDLD